MKAVNLNLVRAIDDVDRGDLDKAMDENRPTLVNGFI